MTRNQKFDVIQLRRGVAIYRVGRSPFWQARIYNSAARKYVVRSTRETSRINAKVAVEELIVSLAAQGQFQPKPDNRMEHSVEFFALRVMQTGRGSNAKFAGRDDARIIQRPNDGIIARLGALDIRKVRTSTIRDYLLTLNDGRTSPLSESSIAKHVIVIRKIFNEAVEYGAISTIPALPKQSARPRPRPSFSHDEYAGLLDAVRTEIAAGTSIKGRLITDEFLNSIEFMVGSFIRPLESDLFSLRVGDVSIKTQPRALHLSIHAGKNGARTAVMMPNCVEIYARQIELTQGSRSDSYLFFPDLHKRSLAVTAARQMFNHVLTKSELKFDPKGQARQLYSLRHYSIQRRITDSGGIVNIYTLAKNAGTSVEMIEKFYAKFLAPDVAPNFYPA